MLGLPVPAALVKVAETTNQKIYAQAQQQQQACKRP
jgi:hypothetical protein